MASPRDIRLQRLNGVLGLALLALVTHVAGADLLVVAPALLVALPLVWGRYVGEETLVRLAVRRTPPPPRRRRSRVPCPRGPWSRRPRTLLLAACRPERGPPAARAAT